MNTDIFAQKVQSLHERLAEFYQDAIATEQLKANLLPAAFKELGTASETLELAAKKLYQQSEELAATRVRMEAERQRYQDLFEFIPDAYLVSDAQGKIQEANRVAAALFNVEQSCLMDKLLVSFIPAQERPVFRSKLTRLQAGDRVQEWTVSIQPHNRQPFDAALTVAPVHNVEGSLGTLRWIVRDITLSKRFQVTLKSNDHDISKDRSKHFYAKGEVISLEAQTIWLVCQGLVKLSTMSESGEEVLMGLVGPSMPFGTSMTSLPTYQATAISENVQLVSLTLQEIVTSPHLTQALLTKITDRIRQTELLLAIAGKRHVKDRLYYLLLWLKQEFGQRVAQGTRLSVRLTHQDLADACCTTRVTVTRLLSKLQKQEQIMFDSQHHIVFNSTLFNQAA